jgi:type VI secretion system protein ImpF
MIWFSGVYPLGGSMPDQAEEEVRFSSTIFDKICLGSHEYGDDVSYSLEQLKSSIRENIEYILNSRSQVNVHDAPSAGEKKNLFYFGLSNFSLQNLSDAAVAEEFQKEAKKVIENFEPRLQNIRVSFATELKESNKSFFQLKIEGELKTDSLKKNNSQILFNTTLIPMKRVFDIDIVK